MSSTSETPEVTARKTIQGHTDWVRGVVQLPGGQHILTCSVDGSLRLWDLESGAQIGENWRHGNYAGVWSMALSPNGKTVASGSGTRSEDNNVRLWDIETRKVFAEWAGHSDVVCALCWSGDGNQVLSGSWDRTARVWDVKSGKTVLTIETGYKWMEAVIYSADATKIATGGGKGDAVKIWDAKTGELLNMLKHDDIVYSLAWTSNGKKLITGSHLIRIFDTATWQEIAVLEGHPRAVFAISLSQNERLLASASADSTARLWNLDTNLPVGPPLQHEKVLYSAALSPDGKVLATGCKNSNAYIWDIHAILKEAGLKDLLQPLSDVAAQESLIVSDATQAEGVELLPGFFNDVTDGAYSSKIYGNYHSSSSRSPYPLAPSLWSASALFRHLSTPFRRYHRNINDATELQQRPRRSFVSRGPRIAEVAAVKDREVIFTAPPPPQKTQQQTQSHAQGSSTTPPAPCTNPTTSLPRYAHSPPVRLLAHLVLFFCCASPQHANADAQSTQQQQGQSQGQVQTQVSSSLTQPTAASTSTTPPAPATSTATSSAVIM